MARLAAQAIGGYYPTPAHLTPRIARLLDTSAATTPRQIGRINVYGQIAILDPCAGEGEALFDLATALCGGIGQKEGVKPLLYACEMEATRATRLRTRFLKLEMGSQHKALHSDSFTVEARVSEARAGVSVLYLNPPYDPDKEYGRLEHRFLHRFTYTLAPGEGVLVYVVPYYALAASAEFIARNYEPGDLSCYRFPDPDFAVYKQVVLLARRAHNQLPQGMHNQAVKQQVESWAADYSIIPVLPDAPQPVITLAGGDKHGLSYFHANKIDMESLITSIRPDLVSGRRGELHPDEGLGMTALSEMFQLPVRTALPPRPAHMVNALAADFFNGAWVEPDDGKGASGWIKARLTVHYETSEERTNHKGEVVAQVQSQVPEMQITLLDAATGLLHKLKSGTVATGERAPDKMTIADFVEGYSGSLMAVLSRMCPALHQPGNPDHQLALPPLARRLYNAQYDAAIACLKLLYGEGAAILLGEIGSGKSITSLGVAAALSPRNFAHTLNQLKGQLTSEPLPGLRPVRVCLILCPPHLVRSWQDQIRMTLPAARIAVLDKISDVDKLAGMRDAVVSSTGAGADIIFALLSRESGKLGSRLTAIGSEDEAETGRRRFFGAVAKKPADDAGKRPSTPRCPRCGAAVNEDAEKIVAKKLRCEHPQVVMNTALDRVAVGLAELLAAVYPHENAVRTLAGSRYLILAGERRETRLKQEAAHSTSKAAGSAPPHVPLHILPLLRQFAAFISQYLASCGLDDERRGVAGKYLSVLVNLALAVAASPERDQALSAIIQQLYQQSIQLESKVLGGQVRHRMRELLLTLTPGGEEQTRLTQELKAVAEADTRQGSGANGGSLWASFEKSLARLVAEANGTTQVYSQIPDYIYQAITARGGVVRHSGRELGAAEFAYAALSALAEFVTMKPCGAPLYVATASPRRYPIATYIARYRRHLVDMVIADEAHEYSSENSAQRLAFGRLAEMGVPTLLLTGSIMKGYADSLFANMWAAARWFRESYPYSGMTQFCDKFAYHKRTVYYDDDGKERDKSYGAMSDRRDGGKVENRGLAPGVLPQFIVQLLRIAVPIDLASLGIKLPRLLQYAVPITPAKDDAVGKQIVEAAKDLQRETLKAIIRDCYTPGYAGKLMYALPMVSTYADRCIEGTGRGEDDRGKPAFVIRYPRDIGGALVAAAPLFPKSALTPKEQELVRLVRQEKAEGRKTIVYLWNTGEIAGLVERVKSVLRGRAMVRVAVLDARKVDARNRQDWIQEQILDKRGTAGEVDVLIVNAKAVETGLNNLIYFSTIIWFENPMCNAITFRQANGRVFRNGQQQEVRIYILFYKDTSQAAMMALWLEKVAESQKADGVSWQAALEAAGAGGKSANPTQNLAEALFKKMQEQEELEKQGRELLLAPEDSGVSMARVYQDGAKDASGGATPSADARRSWSEPDKHEAPAATGGGGALLFGQVTMLPPSGRSKRSPKQPNSQTALFEFGAALATAPVPAPAAVAATNQTSSQPALLGAATSAQASLFDAPAPAPAPPPTAEVPVAAKAGTEDEGKAASVTTKKKTSSQLSLFD